MAPVVVNDYFDTRMPIAAHSPPSLPPEGTAPRHVAVVHPGGAVTAATATFLAAGANLVVTAGADRAIQVLDPRCGRPGGG